MKTKNNISNIALLGLAVLLAFNFTACKKATQVHEPLATAAQLKADSLLIELSKDSALVVAEKEALVKLQADSLYKVEDGKKSAELNAHYLALAALEGSINALAVDYQFIWNDHAARQWHGLDVPATKWGLDNPDNVYRGAVLDSALTYEIKVTHLGKAPIQESFDVSAIQTDSTKLGGQLSFIEIRNLKTDSLGNYVLTANSKADATNKNHIQLKAASVNVLYRNTLSDWTLQTPTQIEVKVVAGTPKPSASKEEIVKTAVAKLKTLVTTLLKGKNVWAGYNHKENFLASPWKRDGGWGFAAGGHFSLGKDEAYVIKIKTKTARYIGFQLADPWLASFDYVNYTASLNNTQAKPDKDGNYTYVLAATDPGVSNWLDSRNYQNGTYLIRWQYLEDLTIKNIDDAIISQQVVKFADLQKYVGKELQKVSPEERKKEQEDRAKSYLRRLSF